MRVRPPSRLFPKALALTMNAEGAPGGFRAPLPDHDDDDDKHTQGHAVNYEREEALRLNVP